jgi:ornithine cyclodeaminase
MPLLLLNEDELRQTLNLSEAVSVIETAFVASGQGLIIIPGSFTLLLPKSQGQVTVKSTILQESPYYVIKIDNYFKNNAEKSLPAASELTTVFDAVTGFPAAILLDNGYLTKVRSAVVGALATEYLANKQSKVVAVLGAGAQAYVQLKALLAIKPVEQLIVWGASPHNVDSYARRLVEDHDVNITIAASVEAAVSQADIIITTSGSQQPAVRAEWLKPGTHITAVGCSNTEKSDLHTDVLQKADVIVVDSLEYCTSIGEVSHAIASGAITTADVQGDLSSLIQGNISGRTRPDQITLADLTGLDWQDAVIATLAMDKAQFLGLGQQLDPGLEQTQLGQRLNS